MAGRVLSKSNETKLRNALAALTEVLSALDPAADEDTAMDPAGEDDAATESANPDAGEAAILGDFIPLTEAAVRSDGTALIKLIAPGWGASGYYSPEVLKRDGPKIFKAGTFGYWDHPTATEEAERPEGSLSRLASKLVSDARWQDHGPAGAGLYADAQVFGPFKDAVNELAGSIGVSIRAAGRATRGEAEGRKGQLIEELVSARSVDWVTVPGAGGKVISIFEAARATPRAQAEQPEEKPKMTDEERAALTALQQELATAKTEAARLREALLLRDAREAVGAQLSATNSLPTVTRTRLLEQASANPPVAADGTLDRAALTATVASAIATEQAYLSEAAGYGAGQVRGMGSGAATPPAAVDVTAKLKEAFGALGLTPAEAETAARSR